MPSDRSRRLRGAHARRRPRSFRHDRTDQQHGPRVSAARGLRPGDGHLPDAHDRVPDRGHHAPDHRRSGHRPRPGRLAHHGLRPLHGHRRPCAGPADHAAVQEAHSPGGAGHLRAGTRGRRAELGPHRPDGRALHHRSGHGRVLGCGRGRRLESGQRLAEVLGRRRGRSGRLAGHRARSADRGVRGSAGRLARSVLGAGSGCRSRAGAPAPPGPRGGPAGGCALDARRTGRSALAAAVARPGGMPHDVRRRARGVLLCGPDPHRSGRARARSRSGGARRLRHLLLPGNAARRPPGRPARARGRDRGACSVGPRPAGDGHAHGHHLGDRAAGDPAGRLRAQSAPTPC